MIFLVIIGMSLATMIPRIIPAFIIDRLEFRGWLNRWLNAIPYAALGALIFPGILTVKPDEPEIGIVGGAVAIVLAYFGLNIMLVVTGAIVTVLLLSFYKTNVTRMNVTIGGYLYVFNSQGRLC